MNRVYRWILSLSLIASCAGVVGLSSVKAQDWDKNQNQRQDLRQDRRQLQNLRNQRKEEIREHDRNAARYYNGQISQLHRDMRSDHQSNRYHRNWNNRNRDWDDYRDRDDQRQWNGSQRWHRTKKHRRHRDRDHDNDNR